ncbi:MAG: YcxB family protein [Clostridiales bacterium]|nr:YcxB family protein [Clostridiales bacterium]
MDEQTELKPIETKIQASKMFWIYFRIQIILFAAFAIFGFVVFAVTLNDAITATRYRFILAFAFMLCTAFASSFCVIVLETIVKAQKRQSVITTALYSDYMIMRTSERGDYGEERYLCRDFTVAKEKKRYFKLLSPNKAGNIIPKDGLSPEQLNAVRRTFGLPLDGIGEVALPAYAENGNAVPDISEVVSVENRRVIKSKFGEYVSRDKQIMKSRFVVSVLIGVCSFVGMLLSVILNYKSEAMPIWAIAVLWAASIIFIIALVYYLYLRNILSKAARSVKIGAVNEYFIFADCIMVCVHNQDSIVVIRISYDKVSYVRETKDDIWIRFKLTGDLTYPIIKSTISAAEYATLMRLLSRPTATDEQSIELDVAPPLNGKYDGVV